MLVAAGKAGRAAVYEADGLAVLLVLGAGLLRWLDLDRLARDYAARDEAGRGLGPLSPRATFRARAGNANLWVDYSRPGMRGRPVWGGLVPWNAM